MKMKIPKTVQTALAVSIMMLAFTFPNLLLGQTTMSILPVNASAVSSDILSAQQWQNVSLQMQDHFVLQLAGIGNISKLSREHILLLLKEMPAPDPENLTEDAYKIISKKENLYYFLQCAIESISVIDKNVVAPIHIIIVDGNNGKTFWEKTLAVNKILPNTAITEQLLLNYVFKPSINSVSKEIKALKY
jgi:hypothetical protein